MGKLHLVDSQFKQRVQVLEKQLHNSKRREKVEKIEKRYENINTSCKMFLEVALHRASKRNKLLKISEFAVDIKNEVTRFFSSTFPNFLSRSGSVGVGIVTCLKITTGLVDDVAKAIPQFGKVGSLVFGCVTASSCSLYAGVYIYVMFTEIANILIKDASFIYLD